MPFTPVQFFAWILTVGITFFTFVAVRFYVRRHEKLSRFSIASDVFLLVSTLFALATVCYMCYGSLHEIEVRRSHPEWKEAQIYGKIFTDRNGLTLKVIFRDPPPQLPQRQKLTGLGGSLYISLDWDIWLSCGALKRLLSCSIGICSLGLKARRGSHSMPRACSFLLRL